MRYSKRNGLMPSKEFQVALGIAQADIAYRVAKSQGSKGVPPVFAADHGFKVAVAVPAYLIFVFPVTMVTFAFAWAWNPIFLLWKFAQVAVGLIIGLRLVRWIQEPATNRTSYPIPTWLLVVGGGCSVALFCFLAVVGMLFYT